ncbi:MULTISPECIES: ankyrin repeat domain-containing protein [Legionella]|uniref:Ankyrin repeat domain-containing protein n=1 Tax=Legionella resiliens TaxID=2905958 RepID=A0ABS8WYP6_9GAMM|nr:MULTISPECIES: ankyrin repeat domain-containing protein [unclassified Legionella]MCE0721685.1 ankyrin repeat domain-containing protein [Legionella sp. 9fVS26]MCE3530839.1 ankyrin repeat domain-containing protein [Legionella sp. 8cVS16]QLZ70400.1 ankyrin repeat domain-containing protein [Legionella sp. PC1000]
MIISDLFNWFQGDEESLHLANEHLSQSLLKSEQSQAQKTNRILLSEIRVAKFNGLESSDALSKLEKHILFMDYLEFCNQQFTEDPTNSLFLITLKYLLLKAQKEELHLNAKLHELFVTLLQEDRENTLSFYQKNKPIFKNHPEIQKRVELGLREQKRDEAVKRVEGHLDHLSKQLSNQKNPLGIIGLCREWVSDIEQFAALILWLLQRHVSTKQILQTYLLHDFLKYHLFTLHSEDSEVFHLYALLSRFPEAKTLVEAAQQTGSDERGFQHYALNGILSEKELQSIPPKPHALKFSLSTANFWALHELFGLTFLTAAVIASEGHKNLKWREALRQTLNSPEMVTKEISGLINTIAHESPPQTLENLAALIDDHTAQLLLSRNEGSVFYLLPYKPKLFEFINEKNITEFIRHITLRHTSEPEIISQLMALFSMLPKKRNPMAQLVFHAIIDNLAQHPLLLDDEKLLRQLRKYPDCKLILSQQSEKIKKHVYDCIIEQAAKSPFSCDNYHIIEDIWVDATRKLTVFDLISPQAKFNLNHKYALQAKIAEIAFFYQRELFDLDAFIESLSLPPVIAKNGVSEYERILIEILAVIDNESIRMQIIKKLENHPVHRRDWVEKEYEGKTIFLKAAKHGNLGLLSLLHDQIAPETFNEAIITAAKANQWECVDRLCQIDKVQLNEEEIGTLILQAAGQGQIKIIKYLLDTYDYEPSTAEVIQILNQAIKNNQLNIVEYFYNFSRNMPNQSVIHKLFNSAVELGFWDIALFIADSEKHPPSRSTIEKAFTHAANTMQLEAMQGFCTLSTNAPQPKVIHRALIKACQLGHLPTVQCLYDIPEKLPRAILEKAAEQAIVNGHKEIISYLYNSSFDSPNQSLANQGFITAVKTGKGTLIEFFYSMAKNKLTQHTLNEAMYWAVKHAQDDLFITLRHLELNSPSKLVIRQAFLLAVKCGKLGIVDYLCLNEMESLNQSAVEEGLILAVKLKNPQMARYVCELPTNSPQKKSLRIAVSKAVSSGQNELADYLSEQLHRKKSPQQTVDSEMDNSSGTNHEPELDNISELDTLSETGLEIDDIPIIDTSLTMDSGTEGDQESDVNHHPKVGISLKKHGLFKDRIKQSIPSLSTEFSWNI